MVRVSVFGLGYVGTTTAACLAADGHDVVGVDPDPAKRDAMAQGRSPVAEDRLEKLVIAHADRIRVSDDPVAAVRDTDVSLVCVGTPSTPDGSADLTAVRQVADQIGRGLAARAASAPRHTVVFRSTMPPGTCAGDLVPRLERASGLAAGPGFGVAVHPEFLREGSSVEDFRSPARTVVGELDPASGDAVSELCAGTDAPVFRVPFEVAEIAKYADNAYHALKVAFANEIGTLARVFGADPRLVADVFLADHRLNVSPAYLRPGFAFGGSCLPKDLRSLNRTLAAHGVDAPLLGGVPASNAAHLDRVVELVAATGAATVAVFGLAFKPGTDDLRESPSVELCVRLAERGIRVRAHDPTVHASRLIGHNRAWAQARLPDLDELLVGSAWEAACGAQALVVTAADETVLDVLDAVGDTPVIDLAGLPERFRSGGGYVGVAG